MMETVNTSVERFFRKSLFVCAVISTLCLLGYALTYLIAMPEMNVKEFIPTTLHQGKSGFLNFGNITILFVLGYAFFLTPVIVWFTARNYRTSPAALFLSASLLIVSFIIEIVNNLPLLSLGMMSQKLSVISPEIALYIHQVEAAKFMALDVAGFTLAYIAFAIYAIVYFKSKKVLSYTVIGSIVAFIANVPFLPFAPKVAIILMSASIIAFALIPIILAKMSVSNIDQGHNAPSKIIKPEFSGSHAISS
jgi:hypothetical protein